VRAVIDSAISVVFNEIRHRATLVKEFGRVPPVLANEARLGQVFLNLLMNAVQSLPEGEGASKHEIRVATRLVESGDVVIEVRDTGVGIAKEIRGRIFEPFFTTKPVGVGTGLGLAICHGIVTSLGGKLTVDSEVGRGSIFRVELPASSAHARAHTPRASQVAPSSSAIGATGTLEARSTIDGGPRRAKVLVIDDEPIISFTLERLLSAEHDVIALTRAEDALQRIEAGERFDVILCDLMMPGVDGAELYDKLLRTHPDQAERMIFITGGAFTARAQEFLARVPNRRVEKPFDVDALVSLIREQVGGTATTLESWLPAR
jgi:CheY-like chemotaxis protein